MTSPGGESDQDNDDGVIDGGGASRKRACHQRRERPEASDLSASTIGRSTSADSVAVAASQCPHGARMVPPGECVFFVSNICLTFRVLINRITTKPVDAHWQVEVRVCTM